MFMLLYGIREKKTKRMLYMDYESNTPATECVEVCFTFTTCGSIPYLVEKKETAQRALKIGGDWFNAGYDCPVHGIEDIAAKFEVFTVEIPCSEVY